MYKCIFIFKRSHHFTIWTEILSDKLDKTVISCNTIVIYL